jgi:hypothetical protein
VKPRHATALALVGWYLMSPPLAPGRHGQIEKSVLLSQWDILESFDSASECETALSRFRAGQHTETEVGMRLREAAFQSRCIASDDPRLKEK